VISRQSKLLHVLGFFIEDVGINPDVRFWHKADIPTPSINVRILGVKRTLRANPA
jgi:hypothetical protein